MAENIEIEIIEQTIEIEVEGASSWNSIADKPETFSPEEHQHVASEITADINNRFVTDAQINDFHTAGSDAETAQSIVDLGIDEIEFSLINSYRI